VVKDKVMKSTVWSYMYVLTHGYWNLSALP